MKSVSRRTVLRYSGIAAASCAFPGSLRAFAGASSDAAEGPIAKTEYGNISGTLEDGIHVFRSVPYGADTAPVRFQAPLPPAPWSDVLACDSFTTRAPQLTPLRGLEGVISAPSLGPAGMTPAGERPRVAPEAGVQSEDCPVQILLAKISASLARNEVYLAVT